MNHQSLWELSMVMWKQLTFPSILGMWHYYLMEFQSNSRWIQELMWLSVSDGLVKGPGQKFSQWRGNLLQNSSDNRKSEDVCVIEKLQRPLIRRPAIERLGLLVRVGIIDDSSIEKYRNKYSTVFSGLLLFHSLSLHQGEYLTLSEQRYKLKSTECMIMG